MSLILSLHKAAQLPPVVRDELEQLIAAIQAWANVSGDSTVPGNLTVGGFATLTNQNAFRSTFSSFSIPDSTETNITLTADRTNANDDNVTVFNINDANFYFDNTAIVYISKPGTYLIVGRGRWDTNVAGTERLLQLSVAGDDTEFVTANVPANPLTQYVHGIIHVSSTFLLTQGTRIAVILQAFQDSGGSRTISGWLSIVKLA